MGRDNTGQVQDFTSMFTWIAGMGVVGGGGALAVAFASVRTLGNDRFPLLELLLRQRQYAWLAVCAAAAPVVSSGLGLYLIYAGVPFLQPLGWKPPEKRSRNCGKLRFSGKAATEKGPYDTIIVGSGMGGLTCGSVLAQLGYKVLVLEAHEIAGGSTHDYNVDGKTDWKFPSGLHYTIPASEEMLQVACGSSVPPVRFGRMGDDTIKHDGAYDRVRLPRTKDDELRIISDVALKTELRARFPGLVPQIERFERLSVILLSSFPLWCAMHSMPWTVRRPLMASLLPNAWWRNAGRSAEEVLDELFADAPASERENVLKLQAYICGLWLDSGCPPDRVSFFMIAAVGLGFPHEGGAYPEGGTGEMAAALVQSIEARGGACFVRAPVAKVLVDERSGRATGVEMAVEAGGVQLHASRVVSACGWRNTARLCKETNAFPAVEELECPQGDGFVMANIGIKGSASELALECTNMELVPAGDGLSVFDGIRNYMKDPLGVPPMEIPMMITFPSVKDRAYQRAKNGAAGGANGESRETAQILCLAKHEWFGSLPAWMPAWQHPTRSDTYKELKKKWTDRLLSALLSIYPQLEGKIELADLSTPQTIEHYLPTGSGSAIGLDTSAGKGCRFTDLKVMKQLDMKSPIPGLWLTGQDALCCGVPLAQAAGLITALRIAGPFSAARFFVRTLCLLAASFGQKARARRETR
eukprot:TRINITY_DN9081_c0_g2_i1.p1 TRINITY_DN9081_c0_g2~~TRINITY_DN9081_c0_g2_i1.p1  ORF type:complete len:711 (-),score=127.27 TRINITY_DN9081_c0_g2_i1:101-2197(-)